MKKFIALFIIIISITSCSTQRFSVNSNSRREVPISNPHFSKWNHFFFWGIGQESFVNADELCKNENGVAFTETKLTFAQGLVSTFTWVIYSPRTTNIYCNRN